MRPVARRGCCRGWMLWRWPPGKEFLQRRQPILGQAQDVLHETQATGVDIDGGHVRPSPLAVQEKIESGDSRRTPNLGVVDDYSRFFRHHPLSSVAGRGKVE